MHARLHLHSALFVAAKVARKPIRSAGRGQGGATERLFRQRAELACFHIPSRCCMCVPRIFAHAAGHSHSHVHSYRECSHILNDVAALLCTLMRETSAPRFACRLQSAVPRRYVLPGTCAFAPRCTGTDGPQGATSQQRLARMRTATRAQRKEKGDKTRQARARMPTTARQPSASCLLDLCISPYMSARTDMPTKTL